VTFATVVFEPEPPVARVTLSRAAVHNAYSTRMRDELFEIFDACRHDDELRVVILRGAGPSFCAGADLSEFGTSPSPFASRRIRFERDVWACMLEIPIPLVAGLHGHVVGTGLELAILSTYRIAARSTQFRMPEARLGLVPAATGTQILPRVAGRMRTRSLLYLGRPLTAEEAANSGLVDEVVDDDELAPRLDEVASQIAQVPRETLVGIVRLLRLQTYLTPGGAIRVEQLLAETPSASL